MKELILLRHAKSSRDDPTLADHDRPLKKRGRRDAPRMGRLLRDEGLVPGRIVSSTAVRARGTAVLLAEACGCKSAIELSPELYDADAPGVLRILAGLYHEDSRVLIVGHNPTFEETLELLTGRYEILPTAALAQIALPIDRWRDLNRNTCGTLVRVWRPKELE